MNRESRERIERIQSRQPAPKARKGKAAPTAEPWPPADCELPSLDRLEELSKGQAEQCDG
ncbi:MAG: hypothetical protein ACOY3P_15410 [Planctomycetota bacterium]